MRFPHALRCTLGLTKLRVSAAANFPLRKLRGPVIVSLLVDSRRILPGK